MRKRKGFTLIEVLVVICIVVILGCMAAAAFSGCETTPEQSRTFVGVVNATHDDTTDEETWHYANVLSDEGQPLGEFTVEDGLPVQAGNRYAFRVWGQHIGEAIPIPAR